METIVGVVGPHDLVGHVASVYESQPGVRIERFAYGHESDAPTIVREQAASVDAWLFTGIVPYTLAASVLTRPAGFVDYTGATLLQALVRLLREGREVTRLSIDTLGTAEVTAVLEEAEIPTAEVHILPFRAGEPSESIVQFHRRHAGVDTIAITCVSTVHDLLADDGRTVLRLVPSRASIRSAFHQLLLVTTNQISESAQVALGLVESDASADALEDAGAAAALALAGTVAHAGAGRLLLVTTYGQLAEATGQFQSAPFLHRLAARLTSVQVGFGIGRSAAEAETLARRALARARSHGPVAAVTSFRNDIDMLLDVAQGGAPGGDVLERSSIGVVAARVGLSVPTLQRLQGLSEEVGESLTTRDIAERLGVQQRTARRILQRLEFAGVAERSGSRSAGGSGRPLTLYRLRL